ncbi:MAG: hypothetical protein KF863_10675 [Rubrivivax sp.]|nr:hypothetical protein [Rubrivivax sp.]
MTEPTLPALDAALHGRQRQAPSRWPADRTLLHVAQDDDGLADLRAADPGADAPLRERLAALLDAGACRREASQIIGVSRQRLSKVLPVRRGR